MALKPARNSNAFEAYYAFIVSGCIGMVQYWLSSGMKGKCGGACLYDGEYYIKWDTGAGEGSKIDLTISCTLRAQVTAFN